jgi:hypothetical protein
MSTTPRPRCLTSPTCVLPPLNSGVHTCQTCRRIWQANGPYWLWTGTEYAPAPKVMASI